MQTNNNAMVSALEALAFEQWLRFMWLTEDENRPCIAVPSDTQIHIQTSLPHLKPLLKALNGLDVFQNGEHIRTVLVDFLTQQLTKPLLIQILDDPQFQANVRTLHEWVQQKNETESAETDNKDFQSWFQAFLSAC